MSDPVKNSFGIVTPSMLQKWIDRKLAEVSEDYRPVASWNAERKYIETTTKVPMIIAQRMIASGEYELKDGILVPRNGADKP